ncbi:MAG: hypothetical protein V3V08_19225 [Nannocystaceae bacterium]
MNFYSDLGRPEVLEWLESASGIDVTPCFDNGEWSPTADCGGFWMGGIDDNAAYGTWADGCVGIPKSGYSESCGPAFVPPPEDTGDTGGTGATGATGGSGGSAGATGDSAGGGLPEDDNGDGDSGCACRSQGRGGFPSGVLAVMFGAALVCRRRDR